MRGGPVLFSPWVEVPAGDERHAPLTLVNDFRENELFQLTLEDAEHAAGTAGVDAEVPVGKGLQVALNLRHHIPREHAPGLVPFSVIAKLAHRNLTLRLPGMMVVPPQGGWQAFIEPVGLTGKGGAEEAAAGGGEAVDLVLRPWQPATTLQMRLVNRSNDWLYCDLQLENTNQAWEYQLSSRRVSLPPWPEAHRAAARPGGPSFTEALQQGLGGGAAGGANPAASLSGPPEARVELQLRPKKKKWIGTLPNGTDQTSIQVRVFRLNPETGAAETGAERGVRVRYVGLRSPLDVCRALAQKVGPFFRFLFSKRGLFTAAGVAAAIFVFMRGGPVATYYDVRDFCFRPAIEGLTLANGSGEYQAGAEVVLNYEVKHAEQVQITGVPSPQTIDPNQRTFKFFAHLPPGLHTIKLEARRLRHYGVRKDASPAPYARTMKTLQIHVVAVPGVVPPLQGLTLADAQEAAKEFNVVPAGERTEGVVVVQRPKAGTRLETGKDITVTLRDGPPSPPAKVPSLVGKTMSAALAVTGGQFNIVASPPGQLEGVIVRQQPEPGTSLPRGADILVTLEAPTPFAESPVWSVSNSPDARVYADLAAAELGSGVSIHGDSFSLIIVGPEAPREHKRLQEQAARGVSIVAIGKGGLSFLQRLDAHFAPAKPPLLSLVAAEIDPGNFQRVWGEMPTESSFALSTRKMPVAMIDAQRLSSEGDAVLFHPVYGNHALVAWNGNRAFWGPVQATALTAQAKEFFKALVRRVAKDQ